MSGKGSILASACFLMAAFVPLEPAQEKVGNLYFLPEYYPVSLRSTTTYEVELWIDGGVDSLHGFDLHIVYDPSKLSVDSAVLADLPGSYPCFCPTEVLGEGYVHLVCAVLGQEVISGPGPFLRLYFRPLEPGFSVVKVDSVIFLRPDNSRIPVKRSYLLVYIKGHPGNREGVSFFKRGKNLYISVNPRGSVLGIYDMSGRRLPAGNPSALGRGFYFLLYKGPSGGLRTLRFFKP